MNNPCDAVWLHVAAIWSAAALAFFQTSEVYAQSHEGAFSEFEISNEFDLDLAVAAGDLQTRGESVVLDLRYRFEAERVLQNGQRWGIRAGLAANTGDGRRGFSQTFASGPQSQGQSLTGLATGWVNAPALDAGSGQVELSSAELFWKTNWLEWRLGWGTTAASQLRERTLTAMRLTRADQSLADLAGGGLSHTGLSLSPSAARINVESRRIIGLSVAASYTPETQRCGVDLCRPANTLDVLSPELSDLFSVGASFDRRSAETGVRWQAAASLEQASVKTALAAYEDPWIASVQASREHEGVTLSISYLRSNDGFTDGDYSALAFAAALERGDWLYSVELARGDSDVFDIRGDSYSVGASRWMGDRTLLSFGILAHEAGGLAGVVETGLRF